MNPATPPLPERLGSDAKRQGHPKGTASRVNDFGYRAHIRTL